MGDPKKRRKMYDTPRKKWDKRLLETEKKLVEFYGVKNKKELRKHETWLKNKRQIAKSLLALPLEKRIGREKELMSGLRKYGLVSETATLDDVLSMKIEAVLEKRLQTLALRKGLATTSKQARQFVVHGHIAINNKKIDSPSYLVPASESTSIAWFKEPMKIDVAPKKDLKKEFEEAKGEEPGAVETEQEAPAEKKEVKKENTVEAKKAETKPAEPAKSDVPKADTPNPKESAPDANIEEAEAQ